MIPDFSLLGWERAKKQERRHPWKSIDVYSDRWGNRRMYSVMIYVYSCLCNLDS